MSEQASISKGIATRYAAALFGLAEEQGDLETLSKNVETLKKSLGDSDDLNILISSPMYTRDEQENAITAIAQKMGLTGIVTNTLSLMASKRRLFFLQAKQQQLLTKTVEIFGFWLFLECPNLSKLVNF